jgi:hypothetical protein
LTSTDGCVIIDKDLSEKELKLLELIREFGYGEITIYIKNGEPYRVEKTKQSIVL